MELDGRRIDAREASADALPSCAMPGRPLARGARAAPHHPFDEFGYGYERGRERARERVAPRNLDSQLKTNKVFVGSVLCRCASSLLARPRSLTAPGRARVCADNSRPK